MKNRSENMKTYPICPVSNRKIDEKIARSNAIITVVILILFGISLNLFLVSFLAIDFFLRTSKWHTYSPIAFLSKNLVKLLSMQSKLINAGPKIFAARIGLFFTLTIATLFAFEFSVAAVVVASVLLVFSTLEGVFGICVACLIYPHLYKVVYQTVYKP